MKIPKKGQILLLSEKRGTKGNRNFDRRLVVVLDTPKNILERRTAIVRVVAIPPQPEEAKSFSGLNNMSMFELVDKTYQYDLNGFRGDGHKVELVGREYLPRCISWNRGITYEKILKREPLEEIEQCDECRKMFDKKELQPCKHRYGNTLQSVCKKCRDEMEK